MNKTIKTIKNYTPHMVNIILKEGTQNFPSDGLARCATVSEKVGELNGINIMSTSFGEVTGLPEEEKDTMIIVSRLVASALKGIRSDLIIPDGLVRDSKGVIKGCSGFAIA